jgi:hypothetical protein
MILDTTIEQIAASQYSVFVKMSKIIIADFENREWNHLKK